MICTSCDCIIEDRAQLGSNGEYHKEPEQCIAALRAWRKEAEARLVEYETLAANRRVPCALASRCPMNQKSGTP